MKEKTLLKIALIVAVLGISILFFVSSNLEVNEKTIDKINKDNVEEQVKLKGIVSRITELNTTAFIELTQPSAIDIVIFKEKKGNLTLKPGDKIEIIGKIDEYDGNLEIIAQRIRVID